MIRYRVVNQFHEIDEVYTDRAEAIRASERHYRSSCQCGGYRLVPEGTRDELLQAGAYETTGGEILWDVYAPQRGGPIHCEVVDP